VKPLLVDLENAWRGGQNQALLLLKGLKNRGHQPELIAAQGSALGERAAAAGVPVHYVRRGWLHLPAVLAVKNALASGKPDLVHANEAHAVSAAWLARAHRRVPFIVSRRVGYQIGKSSLARARYEAASRIVANSQWVADQVSASGTLQEKIAVIFEGAEIPARLSLEQRREARRLWRQPQDALLLGCVGVLSRDKGQQWLIRAAAELGAEFPGLRLLLAGDGPCRGDLEALAGQLGVADRIVFAGFVKDVENVYAALDIFLLPSFFEALNNSLLAAMAYEIPSIAFRRGALPEIIEDGTSGLLVEAASVAELSTAIRRLLRDREFARSLGNAGRRRIETCFSADRMVGSTLRLYEQCLSEAGRNVSRPLSAAL
jgi:glycosyltransferase involved in cell wall biosynthesis